MAKNSKTSEEKKRFLTGLQRVNNKYLTVKNSIALTFFFLALIILSPLNGFSNFAKVLLLLYGLVVCVLAILLICEFIYKTVRLQNDPKVNRYSAIVSLNSFFGLILPLIYFNLALAKVMMYAKRMPYSDTIFCELRKAVIKYYETYFIYWKIDQLIFILVVFAFALLLFGGAFEKATRSK